MTDQDAIAPAPYREVPVHGGATASDVVAVELPLQVIVDGAPFAVIMRTPGEDEALVAGFLFAESVISGRHDIARIAAGHTASGWPSVEVVLSATAASLASGDRRHVNVNAACGMCGRVRVESIEIDRPPLTAEWSVERSLVSSLPGRLRTEQHVFERTGGLHAAGLFGLDGNLRAVAEDVGRHNAVDKVIGRLLLDDQLPLSETLLVVSGRTAYEIVQKAFLAGVPLVAAVSAPSSLAVDLAEAAGVTLAGFVRGDRFNVYTHPQRIGA